MHFELIGAIERIETIATGAGVVQSQRLRKAYGGRRWRKLKGIARIRLGSGRIWQSELHWYECHGVGRRELKIKRLLECLRNLD